MAALSATILSVAFLVVGGVGVERGAPAWWTATCLAAAILVALIVVMAIAQDTASAAAQRRVPGTRVGDPSTN